MYTCNHARICMHIRTHACKHKHQHAHRHISTDTHRHRHRHRRRHSYGHRTQIHIITCVYKNECISMCTNIVRGYITSHTPWCCGAWQERKTKAIYLLSTACYFTYLLWIHPMMSYVTRVNDSCHTYEWFMSHIRMSHVTHVTESCEDGVGAQTHRGLQKANLFFPTTSRYLFSLLVVDVQHTVSHCITLRHTATHCHTLWHTATHCNTMQQTVPHCTTLQQTATDSNRQQHTATHCNALQQMAPHYNALQHTAAHCSTLQHTATHCNTLQHTARPPFTYLSWMEDERAHLHLCPTQWNIWAN